MFHRSTGRTAFGILATLGLVFSLFALAAPVFADGDDSPAACDTAINVDAEDAGQSEDEVTYEAASGEIVTGLCIKSGNDAFGPDNKHSDLITADGTVGFGCYTVTGIGTDSVSVTKLDSDNCHGISHIDVVTGPGESPEESVEASPEESPEASPEESPEVSPEESVEASPEESPEASPEESPEVSPEESVEASPEESPEASPEESPEVSPEESVEASPEESPGGVRRGFTRGVRRGLTRGEPGGVRRGFTRGVRRGLTRGEPGGVRRGFTRGVSPEESVEASPEESPEESVEASPEESVEASPEQSPRESVAGGNPTPTPGGGTVPDTALGSEGIPAWPLALLTMLSFGGLIYLRLTAETELERNR